jgi:hypothetical protein
MPPFFIYYFIFLSTLTRFRPPTRHCFPTVWKKNKSPSKFFSKEIKTKSKCNQQTDVFCLVFFPFYIFLFLLFWLSTTKMNKKKKPCTNCVTERIQIQKDDESRSCFVLYSLVWSTDYFICTFCLDDIECVFRLFRFGDLYYTRIRFFLLFLSLLLLCFGLFIFYWTQQPFWSGAFCARLTRLKKGKRIERERERKRVASGGLGVFSKRGRRSSGSRSRYQGAALMAALSFCRIIRQTDRQRRERNNQTCRSIGGARAYIHCNICPCQRKKDYSRPVLTIFQLATFFFQPDGKLYFFFFCLFHSDVLKVPRLLLRIKECRSLFVWMSEWARHLDAAFLFQKRERRNDESIGILFVCIIRRAREIQGISVYIFYIFIYLVFCVKRSRSFMVLV